VEQFIREHVRA
jgi:hypothetical protein